MVFTLKRLLSLYVLITGMISIYFNTIFYRLWLSVLSVRSLWVYDKLKLNLVSASMNSRSVYCPISFHISQQTGGKALHNQGHRLCKDCFYNQNAGNQFFSTRDLQRLSQNFLQHLILPSWEIILEYIVSPIRVCI